VTDLGKVSREYLRQVVYANLGSKRREVLTGPKFGVDTAVIRVGKGRVVVATADPLSFIPELNAPESAWLSVNLLASDLTTCGFLPQYGIFDFNLPPTMKGSEFAAYWRSFHQECSKLGVAIVGGHTGRYEGCGFTIIGGGVLFATCPEDKYLTSSMAKQGDDLILTKGAAIETTAILTRVFPRSVKRALGQRLFERARSYLRSVSTVKEAMIAASAGAHREGVTAMHDATEGGVLAAALELADASRLGVELKLDSVPISQETEEICRLFRIDPFTSLSEGSLIIACKPDVTRRILSRLRSGGIKSQAIGRLVERERGAYGAGRRGRQKLQYPRFDPYWKAYSRATRKRWD
jgi:hydrogenase expression/formation protein HypE